MLDLQRRDRPAPEETDRVIAALADRAVALSDQLQTTVRELVAVLHQYPTPNPDAKECAQ